MVPSVASITLASITFSPRPDGVMLFVMVKACLYYQFFSVFKSFEGLLSSHILYSHMKAPIYIVLHWNVIPYACMCIALMYPNPFVNGCTCMCACILAYIWV